MNETNEIMQWMIKLGAPWRQDGFGIVDRAGNRIGGFDDLDKTEQVVKLINGIQTISSSLDHTIYSLRKW